MGKLPVDLDVSQAPGYIRLNLTGELPTVQDQGTLRRELMARGHLTADTRALLDLRGVTRMPKYSEIQQIVAAATADKGWPLRRAYLVMPGVQFGFVRQLQAIAPPEVTIDLFTTESEALEWAGKGR